MFFFQQSFTYDFIINTCVAQIYVTDFDVTIMTENFAIHCQTHDDCKRKHSV